MTVINNKPLLRFPEFTSDWEENKISEIFERVVNPVDVDEKETYQELGIRSHGKGIFHKEPKLGAKIGNKRVFWVKENTFIVNIVFAWEQAVAKTTEKEAGLIASHRFPMYEPVKNVLDLDFILYFFLRKKGKYVLELASPGGAGRNKTLGQKVFADTEITIPKFQEQAKIAKFLRLNEEILNILKKKKEKLEVYKIGVMRKIFNQDLRFKDENGKYFPKWKSTRLDEISSIVKGTQLNKSELTSSGDFPCQNGGISPSGYTNDYNTSENTIVISEGGNSCGYVNFMQTKFWCGGHCYSLLNVKKEVTVLYLFQYLKHNQNQLMRLRVGSGLPNIQKRDITKFEVFLPKKEEQSKIANFLSLIDNSIKFVDEQIKTSKEFKKGLVQKMFV
jgi:type I restriction enzyme S subunit